MQTQVEVSREILDSAVKTKYSLKAKPGVNEEVVRLISKEKGEPDWMLDFRLKSLKIFKSKSMPVWGPDLSQLNLDELIYYMKPEARESRNWQDLPVEIREQFDKLGIPEAERNYLGGVGGQFDSSIVYHNLKKELEDQGVVFENMDVAVQKYPDLVKEYFMSKCVPPNDHIFAALHGAVWSGGTFIYVPEGVKVTQPLQAYFRMNEASGGQFEHTLIIVDEGAECHYIEGCSSPRFATNSLHAGCVEIYVKEGARCRYTSVENWSKNTYNLNTKRAIVEKDGFMEWINSNMGCLTEDSEIFTNPKGPIAIKDVGKGDKVYVWDEKTNSVKRSIVVNKIFSGYKNVYKIEAGGRELNASANHPFLTLARRKNNSGHKKGFFHFEWKPLEELNVDDVIGIVKRIPLEGKSYKLPKISLIEEIRSNNQYSSFRMSTRHLYRNDIRIPKESNEDFMWLMGILMGDGYIDLKGNKINIAIHEREDTRPILIETIKKLFDYNVNRIEERYIEIYSKELAQLFTKIGFGGVSHTKDVPDWVFTLPRAQILAFLAGYFDSDGHLQDKKTLAFTSVNKNILSKVKTLGIMCGFGVTRIHQHGKAGKVIILGNECNAMDSWRLNFNGHATKEFPTRSKEAVERIKLLKIRRNYSTSGGFNFKSKINSEIGFARITKIAPLGIKPTYDIEIKNYHNFISNGLIVHNSKTTMLYPSSILVGEGARTHNIGIAFAGDGQLQDTGSKVYHKAPNTSSVIVSKSISKNGGKTLFRGLVDVDEKAKNSKVSVRCDALLMDKESKNDTIPTMNVKTNDADVIHEATVGKISEDNIFYLMSRGLTETDAVAMIVNGFIEPIVKELPIEYAVEFNRLVELEMENAIG